MVVIIIITHAAVRSVGQILKPQLPHEELSRARTLRLLLDSRTRSGDRCNGCLAGWLACWTDGPRHGIVFIGLTDNGP